MSTKGRRGRVSRLTPEQIAKAALRIGLDKATVKSVAEELGMSAQGLYYHVKTRDDLIALATTHAFASLPSTNLNNVDLETFLVETSRDIFLSIAREPVLIAQIVAGKYLSAMQFLHLERFIVSLSTRYGFDNAEAAATYAQLMGAIVGAGALQAGDETQMRDGTTTFETMKAFATSTGLTPNVAGLFEGRDTGFLERFDTVRMTIKGILAERAKYVASLPGRPPGRRSARGR